MKRTKPVKYYTSIDDMPIYNWLRFAESNDLSYMLVNRAQMGDKKKAQEAWQKVYASYIETFGIGEKYAELLEKQRQYWLTKIDFIESGDRFLLNHIDMLEADIAALNKKTGPSNPSENTIHLSKFLGFRVNEREMSVKEYYTGIDMMIRDYKTNKAA